MKRNGQSTLEYAVIVAVVVAALIAMQVYIKRGTQGKLRESVDKIGDQYSAGNVTSKYTTEQLSGMQTKEAFGLDESGAANKGVSYYEVITPAEVKRSATGGDAEKINKQLKDESLFK